MSESLEHLINEHIKVIAQKYNFNLKLCAEKLGIAKAVLVRRGKKIGIEFHQPNSHIRASRGDAIHLRNTPNNGFSETLCKQKSGGMRLQKLKLTNYASEVTCGKCLKKLQVTENSRAESQIE